MGYPAYFKSKRFFHNRLVFGRYLLRRGLAPQITARGTSHARIKRSGIRRACVLVVGLLSVLTYAIHDPHAAQSMPRYNAVACFVHACSSWEKHRTLQGPCHDTTLWHVPCMRATSWDNPSFLTVGQLAYSALLSRTTMIRKSRASCPLLLVATAA